jgi:hypothetical protein
LYTDGDRGREVFALQSQAIDAYIDFAVRRDLAMHATICRDLALIIAVLENMTL